MLESVKDLPNADYYITINGLYIYKDNHLVNDIPLDMNEVNQIFKQAIDMKIPVGLMSSDVTLTTDPEHSRVLSVERDIRLPKSLVLDKESKHSFYQGLIFASHEEMENIKFNQDKYRVIRHHEFGVDLVPKDVSKATGINEVVKLLNADLSQCIAFGDSFNDLEMIQHVGLGVAMGNAVDELKAIADYTTLEVHNDGVHHALTELGYIG
jgi:Cof subfamily protein (haloacid dehalogenase superfamily)